MGMQSRGMPTRITISIRDVQGELLTAWNERYDFFIVLKHIHQLPVDCMMRERATMRTQLTSWFERGCNVIHHLRKGMVFSSRAGEGGCGEE